MGGAVRVWDPFSAKRQVAEVRCHTAAVKDVRWTSGGMLLSGGMDKLAFLTDPATGQAVRSFRHNEWVTAVCPHPTNRDMFLAGGNSAGIVCWDARTATKVAEYQDSFGQVHDLAFLPGGKLFVSTAVATRRSNIDRGIIVWDLNTGAKMSNQVFMEAYSCTSLAVHPAGHRFIAQSSAGYAAIFNTRPPYKLDKTKRFEGHTVGGYRVDCDISRDGGLVATGSSAGSVHLYHWSSSRPLRPVQAHALGCTGVAFHPLHPCLVASCGWDGTVCTLGAAPALA